MNIQQTFETIANNPKATVAAPIVTAMVAPLTYLTQLQGVVSIVSMCLGVMVTGILIKYWRVKLRLAEIELEAALHKKESQNGLTAVKN